MKTLTAIVTGRRTSWAVLVACLLALGLALALVPRPAPFEQANPATAGDSLRVAQWLTHVPSADTTNGIVVWTRIGGQVLTSGQRSAVDERAAAVRALSPQPKVAWTQLSPDRTTVIVVVPLPTGTVLRDAPALADSVTSAARSGLPTGIRVQLTGPLATLAATARAGNVSVDGALGIALLALAAALLVGATRSIVVWIIPLALGAASATVAYLVGADVSTAIGLAYSGQDSPLVFAATLGLVTAWSLVYVLAFGEALDESADSYQAAALAWSRRGRGIGVSALILLVGSVVFLFAADSRARALGLAMAIGIVLAALTALLAVPAGLALLARPSLRLGRQATTTGGAGVTRRQSRRSVLVSFVTAVILAVLMTGVASLVVRPGSEPSDPQATQAREAIDRAFTAGYGNESVMIVPNSLAGDTSVLAPTTLAMNLPHAHAVTVGESYRGFSVLTAEFDIDPGSLRALDTIRELRRLIASKGDPTAMTLVGGPDAAAVDRMDAATTDLETVVPIALVLVLLLLFLADLRERRQRG